MSQTATLPPTLPPNLRRDSAALGHALPALLAQAQHLAASLSYGAHGRRRTGAGDEFWQYRPAQAGDAAAAIDWRRSAKTDAPYIREREWQALNAVAIWADGAQSMQFSSGETTKAARAQLLALALAVMLLRGGERVGWAGGAPPKTGRAHLAQLAAEMAAQAALDDYGSAAPAPSMAAHVVYISDFLAPLPALKDAMMRTADGGARGALLQILDPAEDSFPYSGRTVFLSMGGSLSHLTHSAGDLRARYLARLAARKDELAALARALGWDYHIHHTDQSALGALIWAHHAISGHMR
jgi:uncharacterized protein (DUF58 family)